MPLPQYALNESKDRLVNFHCRGKCQTGRWGMMDDNGSNDRGTKITSTTHAVCLKCGYKATDHSNWKKA